MGSSSDLGVMQEAIQVCKDFGVAYEVDIVSAHRTPVKMMNYAQQAKSRGIQVIIAGAGGAARGFSDYFACHWGSRKILEFYRWLGFRLIYFTNA